MSELPSKVDVTVAVPKKTKKVFTQSHSTTHTFMMPRPIFSREYLPGRSMSVKCNSFIRANNMPVPIFGHVKVHNRAFYVPFRTVAKDFNAFYASTVYNYDSQSAVPYCVPFLQNDDFVNCFLNSIGTNDPLLMAGTSSDYDIVILDNTNTTQYYKFTEFGIHCLTVIESLGYKINWNVKDTKIMSALPLMCYIKVIVDWYYPSAYVGSNVYNYIMEIFNNPIYMRHISSLDIANFLVASSYCTYNPDYFVNAWDTPTSPNDSSTERSISILDVSSNSDFPRVVSNDTASSPYSANYQPSNGTPFIGGTGTTNQVASGVTTQYVIDALRSLTSFTKRHQLSGVRVVDRYLAELGINLSSEILNRSMYIGAQEFDMEFYDVFSHADTVASGGQPVGAYAGKGNGYSGSKEFEFDNGQEFGMFIIINTMIPTIGYYQGQDKETLHVYALDFYHGDFDHMAVQPISAREVYVSQDASLPISVPSDLNSHIFGYVPKYIEYNVPQDHQTGLYRIKTRSGLLPMYTLMRDLSSYDNAASIAAITHNQGFVRAYDANQFNRIFGVSTGKMVEDQFNAIHSFDVTYYDSTLPAYDTYEFEHEDNKKVRLDVNGSKVN